MFYDVTLSYTNLTPPTIYHHVAKNMATYIDSPGPRIHDSISLPGENKMKIIDFNHYRQLSGQTNTHFIMPRG